MSGKRINNEVIDLTESDEQHFRDLSLANKDQKAIRYCICKRSDNIPDSTALTSDIQNNNSGPADL